VSALVRVSARAQRWIRREAEYLSEHSPTAAKRFRAALLRPAQQLSEQPRCGRPGIIPGTRTLVTGDYLVAYRLTFERDGATPRSVEIFAIRHGRQIDAREPT
jgi:plasmid stabilization system protein ParE